MYCKNCGKEIADDSKFCQYCGASLMSSEHPEKKVEVELSNKDGEPIQVEVSKKKVDHSNMVANEIVGNLKVIGLALILFAAYMLILVIVRQKDIKHYDYATHESYFGESCYDPDFKTGSYTLNWEEAYYKSLDRLDYENSHPDIHYYWKCAIGGIPQNEIDYYRYNKGHKEMLSYSGPCVLPSNCMGAAELIEKKWKLSESDLVAWKEEAHETANRDIERWNDEINAGRKYGYKEELKVHAQYASIIALVITILGRYLIKLIKWVQKNQSK